MTAASPADPNEAVAAFAGRIAELRAQTQAANAALAAATGRASSPDGLATVTVDASGALTDIRFAPGAGADPDALRAAVLAAVTAARVEVLRAAREDVAAAVGGDSPAVEVLEQRLTELERVGAPVPGPAGGADTALDDELPYDRRVR